MNNTTKNTTVSFPVAGILGVAFVVMKLAGIGSVANWSWWWVLSPFWIPLGFAILILLVFGIILFVLDKK